ncbi:MAG TPA: hypothetical protein VFL29_10370 [Candidatus Dormibacteraeota bacterium]|nr:hypothetical protein [Candidatus Dormibacteraeota bacterium]
MEELIRDRIHEALEVERTPSSLRARVMDSLPVDAERAWPRPALRLTGQSVAGLVAILLAVAIIAGLLYTRGLMPFIPAHRQVPLGAGLISPDGVAIGPDGSVYLSDFLGDRVFRVRPDGRVVVYAGGGSAGDGQALKASLFHPAGLALDHEGNLYVADTPGGALRKVDARGNISTVGDPSGQPYGFGSPQGLAVDSHDALWFSEGYGTVGGIDIGTRGARVDGSSLPPPGWVPGYIAFDAADNLFISDRAPAIATSTIYINPPGGGCRIVRLSPDRRLSVVAGTGVCGFSGDGGPASRAQINDPGGIAFDAAGNLYFADSNNHRIRRIDAHGVITTVAGTGVRGYVDGDAGQAQLQFPFGVAMSRSGRLYFADMTCQCWDPAAPGRLRVLNLANGKISTVMDGQTPIQAT